MSHPHFLGSMTLKALLEDPNLKNPPLIEQSRSGGIAKVKKESGNDSPLYNYGSAFLGPNLWDKSYGMDINLEYMDLDEFLSENDINAPDSNQLKGIELDVSEEDLLSGVVANSPQIPVVSSPRQYLRTPPVSPSQYLAGPTPTQTAYTDHKVVPSPSSSSQLEQDSQRQASNPGSPNSGGSPFRVDFHVSDQDLALSNVPDYEDSRYIQNEHGWIERVNFDPRKRNFTDEELKPQPIIKKSKKVFVPEDLKDDKYWNRRLKNNFAAKRSRDARRVKENQIALRAAYLEKENKCLREEMSKLRKENTKLKTIADKYEPGASSSTESWSAHSS